MVLTLEIALAIILLIAAIVLVPRIFFKEGDKLEDDVNGDGIPYDSVPTVKRTPEEEQASRDLKGLLTSE